MIPNVFQTVRHLRPSQVLWRLRYVVEHQLVGTLGLSRQRRAWNVPDRPAIRNDFPQVPQLPSPSLKRRVSMEDLNNGILELLNERVKIGRSQPDWRLGERSNDRLWTVTLHYHEWLESLAETKGEQRAEAGALVRHYLFDWLKRCHVDQPGAPALAWNAYAIATRLGAWIRLFQGARPWVFEPQPELELQFLRSLWQQASYLNDHIEWHLRGNHLMRDAVGLAWAGRFLDGPEPHAWLRQATSLAIEQATEQVLPDGGHFERSPGYHVEIMEDLLVLIFLLEDREAQEKLRQTWAKMAEHLAWMRHPDGDIPLFNDAALRGAGTISNLFSLGERLDVAVDASPRRGGRVFADTGMVVWQGARWTLFFDVGLVGPDFQPGHAHADTLTIESSFDGRRLFVDPGCICYDDDHRRRYDRSTEAHNTVCIDTTDSSQMWKIFRVGRRARPLDGVTEIRTDGLSAASSHDGYDHLPGKPRHRREVTVEEGGPLVLQDHVAGSGHHHVQGGLLVAPSWTVEATADGWRLSDEGHCVKVSLDSNRTLERCIEPRPYHPCYGVEQQATRIGWRWHGELPVDVRTVVEPG